MTTTPTPEQIAGWHKLVPRSYKHRDKSEEALLEAATACEALIAERTETCKMIDRRTTERDQALALYLKLEAERDQALARVKELETENQRLRKERLAARAEDFHRTGCLHRWLAVTGAVNLICEKCGAEGAP